MSTTERHVPSVPAPAKFPLPSSELWRATPDRGEVPDVERLKDFFLLEGLLHYEDMKRIVETASAIFRAEPTLLYLNAPITICGDVHGQYYDLYKLIDTVGGDPAETTYLFLGDYVDRGNFSVEVVLLLWAYKIVYPKSFYLIRGNHECRHLTDYFTFKEECHKKYGPQAYNLIMDSFDTLPLAAKMGQFLCVHGGISPSIKTLSDIEVIDRFQETPQSGPMCDLLWADPVEDYDDDEETTFMFNEARGCSYAYGFKAVVKFLEQNELLSLIRAHEAQDAGYKMHRRSPTTGFPTVITLFSAPNYLDAYGNKAAVMRYENNVMNIRQFNHTDHPYWLPGFMDVFTWSMPFVAEKVAEILLAILKLCDDEEDLQNEQEVAAAKEARKELMRNKVRTVTKLMRMYNVARQEREATMQLPGIGGQTASPEVLQRRGSIKDIIGNFEKVKRVDSEFEMKRPPSRTGSSSSSSGSLPK